MNQVGAWLCGELAGRHPPRVLFVQGSNPAVTAVDQLTMLRGLASDDLFTVVHEQVLTDTARLADVVLPATTHFEADDVAASYGSFTLQTMPAVIDRVGESRTNDELAAALAARLGFDAAEFDPDPVVLTERMLTAPPGRVRAAGATVQFVDTVPSHPGGRARLCAPESAVPVPTVASVSTDSRYPLTLLTQASSRTVNSIFAEFDPPEVAVTMSPSDAAARGVVDGQQVRVHDDRAAITLIARVDPAMRPGVCAIPKGRWRRHLPEGLTASAFAPATIDPLAGGACFNDARVEVVRAE
jgi:anaerobic selenocysteine-containing dehydrogenase